MRWPWVSRGVVEVLQARVADLEARLTAEREEVRVLTRHLTERPAETPVFTMPPAPEVPPVALPSSIMNALDEVAPAGSAEYHAAAQYATTAIATETEEEIVRRIREGQEVEW